MADSSIPAGHVPRRVGCPASCSGLSGVCVTAPFPSRLPGPRPPRAAARPDRLAAPRRPGREVPPCPLPPCLCVAGRCPPAAGNPTVRSGGTLPTSVSSSWAICHLVPAGRLLGRAGCSLPAPPGSSRWSRPGPEAGRAYDRSMTSPAPDRVSSLAELDAAVTGCRACPRLVEWREQVARDKRAAFRAWDYWGRPVPGFGPADAAMAIVGLAPAAHGANRTGRMFTGDRSGDVLYAALYEVGLASQPTSVSADDGLRLRGVRITAPVRCAPPENRPTPAERDTCRPWLARELQLLRPTLRSVVVLGGFGWQALLPVLAAASWRLPRPRPAFGHGARGPAAGRRLRAGAEPVRLLPRQPAEHLHRTADPGHAARGAGCRGGRRGAAPGGAGAGAGGG